MPTSVGPKTYGEENLVFGFDTGDTANSYKGEPTTNIIAGGNNRALGGSLPVGNRNFAGITVVETQNYFHSKDRPDVVRLVCTVTGSNGYKEFAQQSTGNTSGSTYIYSFDYKFIVPNDSGTGAMGTPFIYGDGYKVPDSGTRQASVSQTDYPLKDGWTRRVFKYDATYTGNNYYRTNVFANGRFFELLLDNFQIQENTHVTPFTADTRSATQGLIDLTGNSTIDLTNVSFDSNAQVDYDGSSDYINLGSSLNNIGSNATFEMVFKAEETNDNYRIMLGWGYGNSNYSGIHIGSWTSGLADESLHVNFNSATLTYHIRKGHTYYKDNQYHHLVVTAGPGNYGVWIDGVQEDIYFQYGSQSSVFANLIGYNANIVAEIGRRPYGGGTGYFNGKLPLMKIYDRILTASEIKANYNAVKGRFNI